MNRYFYFLIYRDEAYNVNCLKNRNTFIYREDYVFYDQQFQDNGSYIKAIELYFR